MQIKPGGEDQAAHCQAGSGQAEGKPEVFGLWKIHRGSLFAAGVTIGRPSRCQQVMPLLSYQTLP